MSDTGRREDPAQEREIQRELEEIQDDIGDMTEEFDDFEDWYAELRRQYGKPTDDAMGFLKEGDFAAFEQLVRDDYEPPLR